jgi:hypothetical protein
MQDHAHAHDETQEQQQESRGDEMSTSSGHGSLALYSVTEREN